MTAIGFYHLTRSTLVEAIAPLLGRTLGVRQRAVVRAGDATVLEALDEALWRVPTPDWLPHGTAKAGFGADQPIWLTTGGDVPNDARYLFLVGGAAAEPATELATFERVFDVFDGNDPGAVGAARARWAAAKAAGHDLTYWQQTDRGWAQKS